jgi:hypothetical protein
MTKACGILENSSENCRQEEYMTNSGFTSNVDYTTPNMAIMKQKQHNLKMVYPTTTGTIIRCFVPTQCDVPS